MTLPRLHVVTDDEVVGRRGFRATAEALVERLGPGLALHLRGRETPARRLHAVAARVAPAAWKSGAWLFVNDRIDLALAVRARGVQLGRRSLPVQAARSLLGPDCTIGYSAHGVDEAISAVASGAQLIVIGTIWDTPSHPGLEGVGVERVRAAAGRIEVPVIAIGGVTLERAAEALAAGAHGVAVLRGVWSAADPVGAAVDYVKAMEGWAHGS